LIIWTYLVCLSLSSYPAQGFPPMEPMEPVPFFTSKKGKRNKIYRA
jgi:hypothetical protein